MVGDIFWVRLPLTDLSLGVPRPALVVADVGRAIGLCADITGKPVARHLRYRNRLDDPLSSPQ